MNFVLNLQKKLCVNKRPISMQDFSVICLKIFYSSFLKENQFNCSYIENEKSWDMKKRSILLAGSWPTDNHASDIILKFTKKRVSRHETNLNARMFFCVMYLKIYHGSFLKEKPIKLLPCWEWKNCSLLD